MSMLHQLLIIFEKMELKIEIPKMNLHILDSSKCEQLIDRLQKNQISMNEVKSQINQMYFDKKESTAELIVDQFLKSIFDQIGINLSDEVLYPFRTALINDQMINQDLSFNEIMESVYKEMESCHSSSFSRFLLITFPKLVCAANMKYFEDYSKPHSRLMELFCYKILNERINKTK